MVQLILKSGMRNQTIYMVNPVCYKVPDIVNAFSALLEKKATFISLPKGNKFVFDTALSEKLFSGLNIPTESYLKDILIKYYVDGNKPYLNNS